MGDLPNYLFIILNQQKLYAYKKCRPKRSISYIIYIIQAYMFVYIVAM